MVCATTYSNVGYDRKGAVCVTYDPRSISISLTVESNGARRVVVLYILPKHSRGGVDKLGLFYKFGTIEVFGEETAPFNARSNLESRYLFLFFSDGNEWREAEKQRAFRARYVSIHRGKGARSGESVTDEPGAVKAAAR